MTVVDHDRIEMADDGDEPTLDDMFGWLERMPVPEGFKAEIVEGAIHMSPQRSAHWEIILLIIEALRDRFGRKSSVVSDVRIDFPGYRNGFAPDVAKMRDAASKDARGRWHYQDVEFVAEVISKDTAANDYGPKKAAYAAAGVPVYLVADPYQRKCHLYTAPKDDDYATETVVTFGVELDLSPLAPQFALRTEAFLES
ncbi:Uma2 family endonuclease [Streptomyces sp. A7024]|uniref:Uma2 family endonuclease n=1 Tax=Streptomyces coryli TaxID=1128680 RepID=A0A6G4UEV5_9ACTN|nr:Uma2 family endonuclease [Streptomyces coryli]NGN70217.1 Uma2 family endonuclease [Streptomyces coryli]